MKKISKLLSIILVLVLILAAIPMSSITASAGIFAPEIKLVPNRAAAQIGEVVTIGVTVPENSRICSLDLNVIYDNTDFQLIDATSNYVFDADMLNPTATDRSVRFVGTSSTYLEEAATLFTMNFKVLDTCSEIYIVVKETYVVDENDKPVNVTMDTNFVSVPVEIHQSGDENVILAPTCENTGYKTYNCHSCNTLVEEFTPATGHNYKNRVCITCGAPAPLEAVTVEIKEPSAEEFRCEDGIVLHAVINNYDENATVVWISNNNYFKTEASGNDMTVIAKKKGYTTFTASVYDSQGGLIATDSIELYSKAGFFDQIGGFFRKLFRTNQILPY